MNGSFIIAGYAPAQRDIRYSFADLGSWQGSYPVRTASGDIVQHQEFNSLSKTLISNPSLVVVDGLVDTAVENWNRLLPGFTIHEVDDGTETIHIYSASFVADNAYTYVTPVPSYTTGDLVVDSAQLSLPNTINNYSYLQYLFIHEFGHVLGLAHPNGDAQNPDYNSDMTVMSYVNFADGSKPLDPRFSIPNHFPVSPMPYDILALQQKYKLELTVNDGPSVYGFNGRSSAIDNFNGSSRSWTIVDTSGQNTIDLHYAPGNQVIDLRQAIDEYGEWTEAATIVNSLEYVYISKGTIIQNAIGSNGDDDITGNDANNMLTGGPGNDVIDGGAGNDTATFSDSIDEYDISYNGNNGSFIVSEVGLPLLDDSGNLIVTDGTDTLTNVESASFENTTIALTPMNRVTFGDSEDAQYWGIAADNLKAFGWKPTGGSPGGYLSWAQDASPGEIAYWFTSSLGNKSNFYGGTLSYDIEDTDNSKNGGADDLDAADVILAGDAPGLVLMHAVGRPGAGWTSLSVTLSEEGWKVGGLNGPDATAEQMHEVLDNLTLLKIRADYYKGPESGGLDSITMEAPGDVGVSIAALDAVKPKEDSGSTQFTFTVTRTDDTRTAATVDYIIAASLESPYFFTSESPNLAYLSGPETFDSGQVRFAAGEKSELITIDVTGQEIGPTERFTVTLKSPVGTGIIGATASGIILGNDDTSSAPTVPIVQNLSITGTAAGQAVSDQGTLTPFAGVTIADSVSGLAETLTVTLSAAANGTLSNLGSGSYDATSGVYTISGSVAAIDAAFDGLVFTPTAGEVASGQMVTTTFAVNVNNSSGATLSDMSTSVVATAAGSPDSMGMGNSPAISTATVSTPVFRFFDTNTGVEFLTSSASEQASILATRPDLISQGTGFSAIVPAAGNTNAMAVYRFFDTTLGTHFYTESGGERDMVLATRPDLTFEGTGFYEDATLQSGTTPVYRFFDSKTGGHFYTTSGDERASILSTRSDWISEGVAFYAPTST